MKHAFLAIVLIVLTGSLLHPLAISFRTYDHPTYTRVVFQGDSSFAFAIQQTPETLEFRTESTVAFQPEVQVRNSNLVRRLTHHHAQGKSVFTVHFHGPVEVKHNFVLENPFRVVFDVGKSTRPKTVAAAPPPPAQEKKEEPAAAAQPPQAAAPARFRPIETICIDPGHGGEDFGAVSKNKILEKDLTLQIANKLKKEFETRLGLRVVMTRDSDADISLNSRAALANNQQAQVFLSIHVNSSFRKSARGSETYFVSLNATDPEAMELARKENENGEEETSSAPDAEEVKMILWNMAQTEYIRESSKLAEYIQYELNELLDTRNRGVKQAPFRVLMRTAMPAVLVEVAFLSNDGEERKLREDEFQQKVAAAIYNGVAQFIRYYNNLNK